MSRRIAGVSLWRLWSIQGSWHPEGMQSLGVVVGLLPSARRRGLGAELMSRWLRAHLVFTNTNPYLAPLMLGAVSRLEDDGESELAQRLKLSLSRSLGSIGDDLSWGALCPAVALCSLALALLVGPVAALAGWLSFAAGQGWFRFRCYQMAYDRGVAVVDALSDPRVHRSIARFRAAALLAAGVVLVLLIQGALSDAELSQAGPAALLTLGLGALVAWKRWPVDRLAPVLAGLLWVILKLLGQEFGSH